MFVLRFGKPHFYPENYVKARACFFFSFTARSAYQVAFPGLNSPNSCEPHPLIQYFCGT